MGVDILTDPTFCCFVADGLASGFLGGFVNVSGHCCW